ncbi:MAG: LemA family protein, partial [Terriglobia bacterium]
MRRLLIPGGIIAGLVLILVVASISFYNSFVAKDQAVESQWAQVETQYQRRFDLIPNLVSATEGIFEQEREIFDNLADARSRYAGTSAPEDRVKAANQV